MNQFKSKKPHFEHLRKKWKARHQSIQDKLWEKHGQSLRQLALGSIGGLMLLAPLPPQQVLPSGNPAVSRSGVLDNYDQNVLLAEELRGEIPSNIEPLSSKTESEITNILSSNFGFKTVVEIDGIRLNRNYGLIGGEQHLYRYPGDTLMLHADNTVEWAKYGGAGIAPGLGAWGYFAISKEEFREIDKQREKYYLAIQTFLVPGYAENVTKFRDFFKFRKMLVVNPKTGQAVVAVIGDAGPSTWTGKHVGGSPEVMDALGLAEGPRKGAVIYFFIDDPKDEIPLGPIKVRSQA